MDVSTFLEHLLTIGTQDKVFRLSKIKDLDKSCCTNTEMEVIDFDALKDKTAKEKGLSTISSCDALKILPCKNQIHFIELKGLKNYFKYPQSTNLSQKIREFNLEEKFYDSISLLETVTLFKNFEYKPKDRKRFLDVHKHYVIVTDISAKNDALDFLSESLLFLENYSNPIENEAFNQFSNEISNLRDDFCTNFKGVQLLSCDEVDNKYRELLC